MTNADGQEKKASHLKNQTNFKTSRAQIPTKGLVPILLLLDDIDESGENASFINKNDCTRVKTRFLSHLFIINYKKWGAKYFIFVWASYA